MAECIAHIIKHASPISSSMRRPYLRCSLYAYTFILYAPSSPSKLHSLRGLSIYNHRNLIGSWRHSSEYNHLRKFLRIVGLSFAPRHYSQSSHLHSPNYQYLCIIAPPSSRPPCAHPCALPCTLPAPSLRPAVLVRWRFYAVASFIHRALIPRFLLPSALTPPSIN